MNFNLSVDTLIEKALIEDIGHKDITTGALIPRSLKIKADIQFKQAGVLCGLTIAEKVFRRVDENLRFLPVAHDGEWIEKNREVAYIEGFATSILIAERTALNLLGKLSGIASWTRQFVDKTSGTRAKIYDTRKTTPLLRELEKYAVKTGGGENHRMGLYDQVLIKDNHLRILRKESIIDIVASSKKNNLKNTVIGVEVKNLMELAEALKSKADYILLDNMDIPTIEKAIEMRKKAQSKVEYEISGGVNLDTVSDLAKTGVERISIGALTHSAPCLDVSLDIVA